MSRQDDLNRFYEILEELRVKIGGERTLADCDGYMDWPRQGVYFFFEHGEMRENGIEMRVVRVGTHAVSTGSKTTLWKRLRQHRGTTRGKYAGGGNHRGSIFRLHVGSALLNARDYPIEIQQTWGRGDSASTAERQAELHLERAVSEHIRNMPLLWLKVEDEAGPSSIRSLIECNSVSLLSNAAKPAIDAPSENWLGQHCAHEAVRVSGLWNVNYVYDSYDPSFVEELARLVALT